MVNQQNKFKTLFLLIPLFLFAIILIPNVLSINMYEENLNPRYHRISLYNETSFILYSTNRENTLTNMGVFDIETGEIQKLIPYSLITNDNRVFNIKYDNINEDGIYIYDTNQRIKKYLYNESIESDISAGSNNIQWVFPFPENNLFWEIRYQTSTQTNRVYIRNLTTGDVIFQDESRDFFRDRLPSGHDCFNIADNFVAEAIYTGFNYDENKIYFMCENNLYGMKPDFHENINSFFLSYLNNKIPPEMRTMILNTRSFSIDGYLTNERQGDSFIIYNDELTTYSRSSDSFLRFTDLNNIGLQEIETLHASNVLNTSVTLNGVVNIIDEPLELFFYYRKSDEILYNEIDLQTSIDSPQTINYELTNLEPAKFYDYYFSVKGVNTGVRTNAEPKAFFTRNPTFEINQEFPKVLSQGLSTTNIYNLTEYVNNYEEIEIRINDNINNININLNLKLNETNQIKGTPSYLFELISDGEDIFFKIVSVIKELDFESEIIFKGYNEELKYDFNIVFMEDKPLKKIKDIPNYEMGYNEELIISMNNVFDGYDLIIVEFETLTDSIFLDTTLNGDNNVFENNEIKIGLYPEQLNIGTLLINDVRLKIESKNDDVNITDINVKGVKILEEESIFKETNFDVYVKEEYNLITRPEIFRSIGDIEVNFNQETIINFKDYFVENTYNETGLVIEFKENLIYLDSNNKKYENNIASFELKNDKLIINSKTRNGEFNLILRTYSFGGFTDSNSFNYNVLDGLILDSYNPVNLLNSLFPNAENLNNAQRYGYVLLTMLIISVIVLFLSQNNLNLGLFITIILNFFAFVYFVAISYISIGVVVLLTLTLIALGVLWIRRRGVTNNG